MITDQSHYYKSLWRNSLAAARSLQHAPPQNVSVAIASFIVGSHWLPLLLVRCWGLWAKKCVLLPRFQKVAIPRRSLAFCSHYIWILQCNGLLTGKRWRSHPPNYIDKAKAIFWFKLAFDVHLMQGEWETFLSMQTLHLDLTAALILKGGWEQEVCSSAEPYIDKAKVSIGKNFNLFYGIVCAFTMNSIKRMNWSAQMLWPFLNDFSKWPALYK